MTALTSPYLWYSARATGSVSLVLLAATIVLGSLVATRVGGRAVGRFELNEIHRSVSTIALVFVAIHVLATVVDSYVPTGFLSIIVPFSSEYKRLPVAIGTIAIDLMLAVWISSMLKERIRYSSWRFIHWLSWASFAAAALHGFVVGTDHHQKWYFALTVASVGAVALSAIWRVFMRPDRAAGRTAHSPLKGPTAASMSAKGALPPAARRQGSSGPALPKMPVKAPPPAPPRARNAPPKGRR